MRWYNTTLEINVGQDIEFEVFLSVEYQILCTSSGFRTSGDHGELNSRHQWEREGENHGPTMHPLPETVISVDPPAKENPSTHALDE